MYRSRRIRFILYTGMTAVKRGKLENCIQFDAVDVINEYACVCICCAIVQYLYRYCTIAVEVYEYRYTIWGKIWDTMLKKDSKIKKTQTGNSLSLHWNYYQQELTQKGFAYNFFLRADLL